MVEEAVELGSATIVPEACWSCNVCNKKFVKRKSLTDHERKVHKNPDACVICSKNFTSTVKLSNNMESMHTENNTFLCNLCGNQFTDSSNLRSRVAEKL